MGIENTGLTERIGRAVQHTYFRNVFTRRFNSSVMRELYDRKIKREYCLSSTEAIGVPESELNHLVKELDKISNCFRSVDNGAVGNGFYRMLGSTASPRLPSVEDYAKILVLAAARIGTERVVELFKGWVQGQTVRVWLCALLKGVITDRRLIPVDGLRLETLPRNGDDFPRSLYVQIDEHDIRYEQYSQRAMLSLEHEVGPALYNPDSDTNCFSHPPPRPKIRNPELTPVSVDSLCRALSVQSNTYVDWFQAVVGLRGGRRFFP